MSTILIENITIYMENDIITGGSILLENGKIAQVFPNSPHNLPSNIEVINGQSLYALPGFIDTHIHGGYGADVMDSTNTALQTIAQNLPREGTTSFLATTITQSNDQIQKALTNVANYKNKLGHAEIVGIHLEGPFVEKEKAGAQPVQYITNPNLDLFKKWQQIAAGNIKVITMAPELDPDGLFIRELVRMGVVVSAGHTNASYEEMERAVHNGVSQLTHLCNAMNGIHHRDIGAVGAAFLLQSLKAELITDGIHVTREMLELIFRNMGSDRILMITDAMRAKGLSDGEYELGGQPVKVRDGQAVLRDGTLAGSILQMDEGARRMLSIDGVSIRDIVKMTAENPAKQIGVFDRKGSIEIGKDADIILVNENMEIIYTFCRGIKAYGRDEYENS